MKKIITHPLATAKWLKNNTSLSDEQVAKFCDLPLLRVETIDSLNLKAEDPIEKGLLTEEEISRCESNKNEELNPSFVINLKENKKIYRSPEIKRKLPNCICWIMRKIPNITPEEISSLIKINIVTARNWHKKLSTNIKLVEEENPIQYGLCSGKDIERVLHKTKS